MGIGNALMRVTARFIPVDSGYEAVIEERLFTQDRSFVKRLRYNAEEDVSTPVLVPSTF